MRKLKVKVLCETSGIISGAIRALGHEVWSVDIQPSEVNSPFHIVDDAVNHLTDCDMIIAHPPCQRLCAEGTQWLTRPPVGKTKDQMRRELKAAAMLFSEIWYADIEYIAIENPVMNKHGKALMPHTLPKPHYVDPWWFGDPFFKKTGWYLKNLPPLEKQNALTPPEKWTPEHRAWCFVKNVNGRKDQARIRSRSWPGMAKAIADQWIPHVILRDSTLAAQKPKAKVLFD